MRAGDTAYDRTSRRMSDDMTLSEITRRSRERRPCHVAQRANTTVTRTGELFATRNAWKTSIENGCEETCGANDRAIGGRRSRDDDRFPRRETNTDERSPPRGRSRRLHAGPRGLFDPYFSRCFRASPHAASYSDQPTRPPRRTANSGALESLLESPLESHKKGEAELQPGGTGRRKTTSPGLTESPQDRTRTGRWPMPAACTAIASSARRHSVRS